MIILGTFEHHFRNISKRLTSNHECRECLSLHLHSLAHMWSEYENQEPRRSEGDNWESFRSIGSELHSEYFLRRYPWFFLWHCPASSFWYTWYYTYVIYTVIMISIQKSKGFLAAVKKKAPTKVKGWPKRRLPRNTWRNIKEAKKTRQNTDSEVFFWGGMEISRK